MAKDKKRGFFSWFGRGRQEEEQQKEETRVEQPVAEAPLSDTPEQEAPPAAEEPREQAAAELAEEIVHITEQVAAQPVAETPVVAEVVTEEPVLVEEQVVEDEFVESAAEIAEDAREDSLDAVDDSLVVEDHVAEEEIVEEEPAEDAPLPVALDPIVVLPAAETEQERPTKEGFFARLKRSLVKTKQNLGSGFVGLFRGKKIDDDLFEELEEQLLIADVGVETTRKIITSLTEHASRKQLKDADALYGKLKEEMSEILSKVDEPLDVSGKTPYVILMVGVNGVGKTTTIGKMARQFEAQGKSVMLAAGDTFRAAAVEQLQVWGQRNKIPVIAQHTGADSASVIFDAIQAAKARNIDVLIADTAGRLQNKAHLMEELKKIVRVMKKLDEDAPHEVMLTLDASTGQNAVSQAKLFNEAVGLTGITLTKLDGTAKGGVIFAIADQFSIPIRYIGVGEGIEDLRPFKADDFIEALFARED
ncbi:MULTISPECIES: signal recognition particle-docking protein FtsY [Rahnella]|uniref:Signal recognition particle receptor FtsY n=1 Tax=Rahnella laticis TaxID=2787622 RepID=A0ABS0EAV5_9GAMM|nr:MULTISPECIES: signal recognition particle-docking protein FtsY [Rahnella]MBF7982217.1 signal recognition particle-docking protein FtsY [Rahnella laticis]MBF8002307.1 signal recognition particle-docking protein FtsY [Rahnella sp. LAC-M12]